jgi:hypothetical protein
LEDEQEQVAGKITSKGKRDISELGSFGRILNNFDKIAWRLDNYFPRFYPLFSRHISFREAFR